ncbi:DNA replication protein psf2 [Xanthoria parietina]
MALTLPPGLTPPEVAFLCEMELVTVIPRQRLEGLQLLGGPTVPLIPPHRTPLPLWLALLLKRQNRANIFPPPWLSPSSLDAILQLETSSPEFSDTPPLPRSTTPVSPPFLPSATADAPPDALPYHWLELSTLLLEAASDDIPSADHVRRLLRDLREVRMAKLRAGVEVLEGGREVKMNGVGAMEVSEGRAFIGGVVDGLRKLGAGREISRREREGEEGGLGTGGEGDNEDDMEY